MAVVDRTKYMSVEEVKQLRTVAEARAIVDLRAGRVGGVVGWMVTDMALSTGLRVSEIAAVNVEDVDGKRGCMTVTRLKRRKPVRETLAIGKELADHVKDYLTWRGCRVADMDRQYRMALSATQGPLFVGCRGPLTAQGLQRIWKRAIGRARLPKELSIHSARHTIAVHLLRKTGNLRQVQKQLGHSSPATTANMYADVTFEDMQRGVTSLYG